MDEMPNGRRAEPRLAAARLRAREARRRLHRLLADLRHGLGLPAKRRGPHLLARPLDPARAAQLVVAARAFLPLAWATYRAAHREELRLARLAAAARTHDERLALARAAALAAALSVAAE